MKQRECLECHEDSIKLLNKINLGCDMAIDAMEEIIKVIDDKRMLDLTKKYNDAHIKIKDIAHRMLNEAGETEQEPSVFAKMFAQMQSKMKLLMRDDIHEAAGILTDGCHMGIKSLCEYKNTYIDADEKSVDLCDKLIEVEKKMLDELQPLL